MLGRDVVEEIANDCGLDRVASQIADAALPAARLDYSDAGTGQLGGLPRLPEHVDWPSWRGRPMSFLAQVTLDDLPPEARGDGLPETGALAFFWDSGAVGFWTLEGADPPPDAAGWGFDPADAGSSAVIYAERLPSATAGAPTGLPQGAILKERAATTVAELTVPSYGSRAFDALDLSDGEVDAYLDRFYPRVVELEGALGEAGRDFAPRHQLLGHPDVIQGDMQLEAQLVTNGLDCGPRAATTIRGPPPSNWELTSGGCCSSWGPTKTSWV